MSVCILLVLVTLALLPAQVLADGGAPNLAYIAGTEKGVTVVDVQQQQISKTIEVPGDATAVTLSLDGRFLYVAQPALDQVSIVSAGTGNIICSANVPGQPTFLAFDPNLNGSTIFAAGNKASDVLAIDSQNCTIKRTFKTDGPIYGLGFTSNGGNQLWVSNEQALTIFKDTGERVATIAVPEGPRYLSIPPGATVYATTQKGSVLAVDLVSHKLSTVIIGGEYGPMDYDGVTGEIYVPDRKNKQYVVLNPVNSGFQMPKQPNRVIAVEVAPASIAITSDGQLGFAALTNGTVAMYDVPGRQLITTIPVGGTPHFIITGLYPPALGTTPEQASWIDNIAVIVGYIVVIALMIIPIILFRRYARVRDDVDAIK